MNPKFMRYKKIVFTPKVEFPSYDTQTESEDPLDSWYQGRLAFLPTDTRITLSSRDWTWTVKMVRSEKYNKVAAIVGHDLAEKVLLALGEK